MANSKTVCPISRATFTAKAPALTVTLGNRRYDLPSRTFSTGSLGWNLSEKVTGLIPEGTTKARFTALPSLTVSVAGRTFHADAREFSTGSVGWYATEKVTVTIGGKEVKCQVGLSLTVVGSKDLPANGTLDPRVQVGLNVTVIGSKDLAS
jgi:hypothetical protein